MKVDYDLYLDKDTCSVNKGHYVESPGGGGHFRNFWVGMCRCEGYGFQAVYSRIGYINQSVWV